MMYIYILLYLKIKGKTTSDKAAIMFQSTWRRYNVLRGIALKEKERIVYYHHIIENRV